MKIACATALFLGSPCAESQLIQYSESSGGNGNWYECVAVPNRLSWSEANDLANARGGYLATLTTASENMWAFDTIVNDTHLWYRNSFGDMVGPWIGGFQDLSAPNYSEPDGGWAWITGESWSFTAWFPGQPNNAGRGNQDRIHFWADNQTSPRPTWQDKQNSTADDPVSFLIEYDWVPANRPVQFTLDDGGNNNWYELVSVPDGISWSGAKLAAEERGGFLATLTNADENNWVFDNLAGNPLYWFTGSFGFLTGPYVGGFQDIDDPNYFEPDGGWKWVTEEVWGYTNWAPGQPNNALGDQTVLHYWTSGSEPRPTWQDVPNDGQNRPVAYIVEYSINPVCPADTNNDGNLDAADFTYWLLAFNTGLPACDQNADGLCTPSDFTAWIASYNAGCD